jgi:hypothetical protein
VTSGIRAASEKTIPPPRINTKDVFMNLIPTRIHGMLDYGVGLLLILAPWLFGFATGGAEMWVPIVLGVGAIGYSLFTRYELGLVHVIPMHIHLAMDIVSGLFLAVSPWLFGFADLVYWPHVAFGLLEIGAAAMSQRTPRMASRDVQRDQNVAHA